LTQEIEQSTGHPLLVASLQYLEGARDSAKRKWFARTLRNPEEMQGAGHALILHTPIWQWEAKKNTKKVDQRKCRVLAYVDAELLVASSESMDQSTETEDADAIEALTRLKLGNRTRIIPIARQDSIPTVDDVVEEGIRIWDSKVQYRRDACGRACIVLNPLKGDDNGDVGSRPFAEAIGQGPLTSSNGTRIDQMLLVKDVYTETVDLQTPIRSLLAAENARRLGALCWWGENRSLPPDITPVQTDIDRLFVVLKYYTILRNSCDQEYRKYRFQIEMDAWDSEKANLYLEALSNALKRCKSRQHQTFPTEPASEPPIGDDVNSILVNFIHRRLGVLQGPPGTGKTEFAALAIILWALWRTHIDGHYPLVLVTGVSHNAVNNILRRCATIAPVVMRAWSLAANDGDIPIHIQRWIRSDASGDRVFSNSKESRVSPSSLLSRLTISDLSLNVTSEKSNLPFLHTEKLPWIDDSGKISGVFIVGCVTAQLPKLLNTNLNLGEQFKLLVMDEASQIKLHDALLAFPNIDPINGQLFIVGDHRQLGPIVDKDSHLDLRPFVRRYEPYQSAYDFATKNTGCEPVRLSYSYRLQEETWKLIQCVYANDKINLRGRVRTAPIKATSVSGLFSNDIDWEGILLLRYSVAEVNHRHTRNFAEASIVKYLLNTMPEPSLNHCAVLVPFKDQLHTLREVGKKVYVTTVDKMQGSERDTIIFSAVCGAGLPGFLEDFAFDVKRANVAFSRSKKRLIVIAADEFLNHAPASSDMADAMQLWKRLRDRANQTMLDSPFQVSFNDENQQQCAATVNALMVSSGTKAVSRMRGIFDP